MVEIGGREFEASLTVMEGVCVCEVMFSISNSQDMMHAYTCTDATVDFILGIDFMAQNSVSIELKNGLFRLGEYFEGVFSR